jgi:outer membrane immunogenic protein
MQNSKLIFSAAVAISAIFGIGAATSAFAADMSVKAPIYTKAIASPYNWTGFYVGLNAGYAWTDPSNTLSIVNGGFFAGSAVPGVAASGSQIIRGNGFIGGAQAGYNWQITNWVVGIEGDIQGLSNNKKTSGGAFTYTSNNAPYTLTETAQTRWLATIRPRAGIVVGSALWYVTGGLAIADEKFSQSFNDLVGNTSNTFLSKTAVGWTAGAGVEWAFVPNWSVKGEYLYVGLNNFNTSASGPGAGGGFPSTFNNSLKDNIQLVRLGLNHKF